MEDLLLAGRDPGRAMAVRSVFLHNTLTSSPLIQVYCGKIPNTIYEEELIPHLERCGQIWELRLMMDPVTGLNKSERCLLTVRIVTFISCVLGVTPSSHSPKEERPWRLSDR